MMMLILEIVSLALLGTGSLFAIVGGLGLLRLPDFFSRMHSTGINDTLGAGLIVAGLILQVGLSFAVYKLLAILFFLAITSPSSCHALARSALMHGLQPELDVPRTPRRTDEVSP